VKLISEWIQAGFFLIKEAVPPPRDRQFLPPRIITASDCIAEVYPGYWALPGGEVSSDGGTRQATLADVPKELKLTGSQFDDLRSWVERALASLDLGWPNVFLNLRAAREFKHRFMHAISGVHLIGLAIASDNVEEFTSDPSSMGEVASKRLPPDDSGVFLGFDVLGVEFGGDFHTFSCNGLEKDYVEKLGITFNAHGLIPDQDQALAAAEYTNRDETGAEPVPWFAAKLYEYDLVNSVSEVSGGV
jgi:hypothetical protein